MSIQIKILKDFKDMRRGYIYSISEENAKKLVEHGCVKDRDGILFNGTGDLAVYYSRDNDNLHNTLAPSMIIPKQLFECRLLRVSDEKKPFETAWQKSNNSVNDSAFYEWIIDHEKYGVLCGPTVAGDKYLVVIDFDNEDIQREVLENGILPETFTCKTARKGLYHLYFFSKEPVSKWKVLTKDKDTLADVQGTSTQVIGPGSRIPDGRTYEVVKDLPIAMVDVALLHKALDQFDWKKSQELLDKTSDELTLDDFKKDFGDDKALEEIRNRLRISDLLRKEGISTSRNPTKCPFHSSKGGKCLGFDDKRGIWSCFHCLEKGTAIDLWMKLNNVDDFVEAKKKLCEEFGIQDTYAADQAKAKAETTLTNGLPMVRLPQDNYSIVNTARELGKHFYHDGKIFFKPDENNIVEITEYDDTLSKKKIVGFEAVNGKRMLMLIVNRVNTYIITIVKKQEVPVVRDPTEQTISLIIRDDAFRNALYIIKRFLNYPIPFLTPTHELIIPRHIPEGHYDERFQAYFTSETPELKLLDVEESKRLLFDLLKEFCFKEERDLTLALAYVITPMCRGLYHKPNNRTPLFILSANRERAGKDYLAGVVGILYEGQPVDDTPFVTGEKNESNSEELRKKLTTALKRGRRRIHSSNNRGYLANAVLEQFLTSEVWRDRELGRNNELELNNEVDVSLSANMGLTYTPDLWFRSRPIRLFYAEEDPNERRFERTDLHGYVYSNRGLLLSAVYTLIHAWWKAGMPAGKVLFTSFPEWARVVGGVMEFHKLGSPCISIEDDGIGGDKETQSMKELISFMAVYQLNDATQPVGYTIGELRHIVVDAHSSEDMEGFAGWDLSDRGMQTKFGTLIKRFVGREFHNVHKGAHFTAKLVVAKDNKRSNKVLYGFPLVIDEPKRLLHKDEPKTIMEEYVEEHVAPPESTPVPIPKLTYGDVMKVLLALDKAVPIDELILKGIPEEQINSFITKGLLYSPRPGYVGLLK